MLHVTVTIIFILHSSPPDKMMASFSGDREMSQFTCPDAQIEKWVNSPAQMLRGREGLWPQLSNPPLCCSFCYILLSLSHVTRSLKAMSRARFFFFFSFSFLELKCSWMIFDMLTCLPKAWWRMYRRLEIWLILIDSKYWLQKAKFKSSSA